VVVGEWVDVEQTLKEIRFHKLPDELEAIRGACGVADHPTGAGGVTSTCS